MIRTVVPRARKPLRDVFNRWDQNCTQMALKCLSEHARGLNVGANHNFLRFRGQPPSVSWEPPVAMAAMPPPSNFSSTVATSQVDGDVGLGGRLSRGEPGGVDEVHEELCSATSSASARTDFGG